MTEDKRITIKDIAQLAGVSKGTVDRVIHNRGEVSEASRQKVLEVAQRIGYKPNIYASLLASQKKYLMACLLPDYGPGEYWERVAQGLEAARKKSEPFNIDIRLFTYDLFSIESFQKGYAEMIAHQPDAIVLAPTFREKVRGLVNELSRKEIPCLLIDSYLSDCPYLAYYGMPMFQSGYLAAHLLLDRQPAQQVAIFRIHKDKDALNNSAERRREGFMSYLADHHLECDLIEEYIHPYDSDFNGAVLERFFQNNPNIRHIITFNSRVHLIAEQLEREKRENTILVGFDDLPKNIEGLKKGSIQFLIAQHSENLLSYCADTVINRLIYHNPPEKQNHFVPMDILTRYNADYYRF